MNTYDLKNFNSLLSKMKWALKNNQIKSINEGLRGFYAFSGYVTVKTAEEWKKQGRCVVEGETPKFLLDENEKPYPTFGLCQTRAMKKLILKK